MAGLVPAQNYDHLLTPVSGWNGMHDLQYNAAPSGYQNDSPAVVINRGSLVTLDSDGKFQPGFEAAAAAEWAMACWAINSNGDFDVIGDVGNTAGGTIGAYPATCGMEFMTTEFDTTDLSAYTPNTLLTHGTLTDVGKVKPAAGAYSLLAVVGVVSRGVRTEVYDQTVLHFWPVYCPAVKTS
jgi:hypothetical protein